MLNCSFSVKKSRRRESLKINLATNSLFRLLVLSRSLSLSCSPSLSRSRALSLTPLTHSIQLTSSLSRSFRSDVAQQLEHLVLELLRWYTAVCSLKPNIALDLKVIRIENSALNSIPTACRISWYVSESTNKQTYNKTNARIPTCVFPAFFGLIFTIIIFRPHSS